MAHKIFFTLIIGLVSGIFFRSFFDFGFPIIILFLAMGVSVFVYWLFNKKETKILFLSIIIAAFSLGAARLHFDDWNIDLKATNKLVGKEVVIKGIISDEPDKRENGVKLTARMEEISLGGLVLKDNLPKIMVSVDFYPEWRYGDYVELTGVLKKPKNFTTESGREFNYVSYLAKDGIYYEVARPRLELVEHGHGNFVKDGLFFVKKSFMEKISEVVPEPEASLLGGLLLGAKESLGKEILDDFRKVGLIHIVVLSGYNITIVAETIMRVFSFLPRTLPIIFGGGSIILFAIMTGGSATVVRASIMSLIVILGKATGRMHNAALTLFIAAFLMLLHNPRILAFDPSFQLSFLATLGLVYLSPALEKYFHFVPGKWQIRELFLSTISTQIFVMPLILYNSGNFSAVALPVNLLVLVFVPLTMLLGFLTGVWGFVSGTLSLFFGFLVSGLLYYDLKIVEFFSSLPFASFNIPSFPLWLMISMYIFYAVIIFSIRRKNAYSKV